MDHNPIRTFNLPKEEHELLKKIIAEKKGTPLSLNDRQILKNLCNIFGVAGHDIAEYLFNGE